MRKYLLMMLVFVALVAAPAAAALLVPALDFEANEPGNEPADDGIGDYTPLPWVVKETAANPSWWEKASDSMPYVTAGGAYSGTQKLEFSPGPLAGLGASMLMANYNTPSGESGPYIGSGGLETWASWWVRNSSPGTDWAGRMGVGGRLGSAVGVAVGHPDVAGGAKLCHVR